MTISVIEVSAEALDSPDSFGLSYPIIYEHMKYFCSKRADLPAISCEVEGGEVLVKRAGVFLRIARELGREKVLVMVPQESALETIKILDGRLLDEKEMQDFEFPDESVLRWHVVHFSQELSAQERNAFSRLVSDSFEEAKKEFGFEIDLGLIQFQQGGLIAEFLANPPLTDPRWYSILGGNFQKFSDGLVKIESYQGMKFN